LRDTELGRRYERWKMEDGRWKMDLERLLLGASERRNVCGGKGGKNGKHW
jgi:hypothetical protein